MGSTLRIIGLIFVISPFAAMFSEPFFEALFDQVGVDTENWAAPIMTVLAGLSELWSYAIGAALFGAGVWAHYLALKFDRTRVQAGKSSRQFKPISIPRQVLGKSGSTDPSHKSFDTDHDFDFVLNLDRPFFAEGNRSDDGIDMAVRLVVRNRSPRPLWVDIFAPGTLELEGKKSENPGGGISRPMRKESNYASVFGGMRIYDSMAGKTGTGTMSYLFGESKETARWIFDVDVDFRILEDPKTKGKLEQVPVEIIENRSSYRLKPAEDQ